MKNENGNRIAGRIIGKFKGMMYILNPTCFAENCNIHKIQAFFFSFSILVVCSYIGLYSLVMIVIAGK